VSRDGAVPVVCCDLDGVLWRGDEPIPGAADGVEVLRRGGLRVGFVSNNSSHTTADVLAKLDRFGVEATDPDVITSAHAAAALLEASLPPGAPVLVCGGPGLREALAATGLTMVSEPPAAAVVVGLDRTFGYDELDRTSRAVREGARFVAANLDATYPIAGGLQPGTGAIVAAISTASGRAPEVAGKPAPPMVDLVRARWGVHGAVVGDRPSSDGALATALGWPFALVLSGVAGTPPPPGGEAVPDPAPPFVAADLGVLAPRLVDALARPAPA
jgi:glycerol-1-phosphatase